MSESAKIHRMESNRRKYRIHRLIVALFRIVIMVYFLGGMIFVNYVALFGNVKRSTSYILYVAYLVIMLALGFLFQNIVYHNCSCTLMEVKSTDICPVCGKVHDIIIRAESPAHAGQNSRYIYRWCPKAERVVNVYTRFDKDCNEILTMHILADDYDRIYECKYRKIRKKEMKKEDKEASAS